MSNAKGQKPRELGDLHKSISCQNIIDVTWTIHATAVAYRCPPALPERVSSRWRTGSRSAKKATSYPYPSLFSHHISDCSHGLRPFGQGEHLLLYPNKAMRLIAKAVFPPRFYVDSAPFLPGHGLFGSHANRWPFWCFHGKPVPQPPVSLERRDLRRIASIPLLT